MRDIIIGSVAFLLALVISSVWFIHARDARSEVLQPIQFNHKLMIEKTGFTCMGCHKLVKTNARAGIPNIETCGMCHSQMMGKSNEENKVVAYVRQNKQIPWRTIYYVPDYVYFSHRRHVGIAKLKCSVCHGAIASMTTPPRKQFLAIKMQNCIDCHEKYKASTDCYACHR